MADTTTDPVAEQIEWSALKPTMGSNFRTHRLAKTRDRWTLKPTSGVLWMVAIAWFFGVFGLLAGGLSVGKVPWWGTTVALAAGVFFSSVGFVVLRRVERPLFDLQAQRFRAAPDDEGIAFADLHAVQLAPYLVDGRSENDRYGSCELNLVHRDASRTRVVSHGNVDALRCDAREIAAMLRVPLWDGTERS